MERFDDRIRCRCQEAIDQAGAGFDFMPRSPLKLRPDAGSWRSRTAAHRR